MSDSNRIQIGFIKETTWGEIPASPNLQIARLTGESINYNIENIVSNEIRADRQTPDLVEVGVEASGDLNFELSYGTYDAFLEAALFSSPWTTEIEFDGTAEVLYAAVYETNVIHFETANPSTSGLAIGEYFYITGFVNPENNGWKRIKQLTPSGIIVVEGDDLIVEAYTAIETTRPAYITNGITRQSFTLEKGFLDVSEYLPFSGMVLDTLNLNFESKQILTGNFTFMGKAASISPTSIAAATTDATTTGVMNAVGNVAVIKEGGLPVDGPNYISSLSLTLSNNLRPKPAIGYKSLIDVGAGTCSITGSINTYFGDSTLMEKVINSTRTSFFIIVEDDAGNKYLLDIPEVKFGSPDLTAGGINQDVMANMNYTAIMDPEHKYTLRIFRIPAGLI